MVPYIMADEDYNLSYNDAITESRNMMDGRKMDLFILALSFFGWMLLIIVTFGLAAIYVVPYMNATFAAFYLDIKGEGRSQLEANPVGGKQVFQDSNEDVKEKEEQDEWDF